MKNAGYIWGAAKYGKIAVEYCAEKFNIVGFIDKRADEQFSAFVGYPVISPEVFFKNYDNEEIILAVTYPGELIEILKDRKFKSKIYIFDGQNPDAPFIYEIKDYEICVPEYINKMFSELEEYSLHYSELSEYQTSLYNNILNMVKKYPKDIRICELGCGSGQMANMLFDNGYINYIGIDFSSEAIVLAKKANPMYKEKFICSDIFSNTTINHFSKDTLFLCFEVLEHMEKDCKLFEMLPREANIVFSVPSFKSFNHLRTFNTVDDIKERYSMLDIIDYLQLPASQYKEKYFNLVLAKIKE